MNWRTTSVWLLLIFMICSCEYSERLRTGEELYAQKRYFDAIPKLTQEYEKTNAENLRARNAYLIAQSYSQMNQPRPSIGWYQKAVDNGFGLNAVLGQAEAYRKIEDYAKAKYLLLTYEANNGSSFETTRLINVCNLALQWQDNDASDDYDIQKLDYNTTATEYATSWLNGALLISSDQFSISDEDYYPWTGRGFSDLYTRNGNQIDLQILPGDINTSSHEGAAVYSPAQDRLYFTRCDAEFGDIFCKIYQSERIDGAWSEGQEAISWSDNQNYGHPCLMLGDSLMIFVAERTEGYGGKDLWYTIWQDDIWQTPRLMPRYLNSEGNEMFPTADQDTLYFSSNGLEGVGGLDIFKTFLKADGSWSRPKNMRFPINSGADDFAYLVPPGKSNTGNGYFSSSRGGDGLDKIYRFDRKLSQPSEPVAIEEKEEPVAEEPEIKVYLAVRILEKQYNIKNNPNSGIKDRIALSNAQVRIRKNGIPVKEKLTNQDGRIITDVSLRDQYEISAAKPKYLSNNLILDLASMSITQDTTINVDIVLDQLIRGKEIVMENIFYDYDKWDIRADAEPSLNGLAKVLKDNRSIRIQLSSHTDCRGEDDYNKDLSQKRAQAAVNYLEQQGINQSRLVARGYGESKLAINCICDDCSEQEHQTNRRTTFKILY